VLARVYNSFAILMLGVLVPNKLKSLGKLSGEPRVIDIYVVFQKIVGQNCREVRLMSVRLDILSGAYQLTHGLEKLKTQYFNLILRTSFSL
jgi:hypothetical protein